MKRILFGKALWQNTPNEQPTVVLFAFAIYFHPAGRSCSTDLCVAVIELFGAFWGQKRTVKLVSLAGARWGFVPASFVPGGEITVNCFERSERGKGSSSCGCLSLGTWGLTFSAVWFTSSGTSLGWCWSCLWTVPTLSKSKIFKDIPSFLYGVISRRIVEVFHRLDIFIQNVSRILTANYSHFYSW